MQASDYLLLAFVFVVCVFTAYVAGATRHVKRVQRKKRNPDC